DRAGQSQPAVPGAHFGPPEPPALIASQPDCFNIGDIESRLPLRVRPQTASNYGCQLGRGHGIGAASEGALEASRANANDRLPRASLGWVEGRDGIVEGRDVADVRPQSSVPHPLNDLTQLGTIGL